MRCVVTLKADLGPQKGREFVFDAHDIFIFGRAPDCRCSLPADAYLSAHHFMVEINPPDCELRDLGSKNGTFVNGAPCGRRERGESPEEAARRAATVRLKTGDLIRAGETVLAVSVRTFMECQRCAKEVGAGVGQGGGDAAYLCAECARKPAVPAPKGRVKEKSRGVFTRFMDGLVKPEEARPPLEFPGYSVERELKEGGMGKVYLARRGKDGLKVVLKVVKPLGSDHSDKQEKYFLREMKTSLALKHSNIVEFYEEGRAGGGFFFAMEFCAGGSVSDLMVKSGGRLDLNSAAGIVLQALEGLVFAHSRDIVHRDLKPDNLLLADSAVGAVAKIADFGLAKNFSLAGLSGMTASGDGAGGTLAYMPKEQLKDFRSTRPVSDVFSMGASLYNMLTGEILYDFAKCPDHCAAILRDKIVPIRRRGVSLPGAVMDVVDRACAPESGERFATAAAFRDALRQAVPL